VNNLPRVAPSDGTAGNRTRDLLIMNLMPYRYTTKPHSSLIKMTKYFQFKLLVMNEVLLVKLNLHFSLCALKLHLTNKN